jgi:hypothetical protein
MKRLAMILAVVMLLAMAVAGVYAGSDIRNTKHNLGSGAINNYFRSTNYSEICVFCHTPHAAVGQPLWNRNYDAGNTKAFIIYSSATFNQRLAGNQIFTVDATSKLCFSCHEDSNTVLPANTPLYNNSNLVSENPPTFRKQAIHSTAALGLDLKNDHPVGFSYDQAQVTKSTTYPELVAAATVVTRLGETNAAFVFPNGNMTCASCHDVHGKTDASNNIISVLLRRSNASSMLCFACHIK